MTAYDADTQVRDCRAHTVVLVNEGPEAAKGPYSSMPKAVITGYRTPPTFERLHNGP